MLFAENKFEIRRLPSNFGKP